MRNMAGDLLSEDKAGKRSGKLAGAPVSLPACCRLVRFRSARPCQHLMVKFALNYQATHHDRQYPPD